MNIKTISLISAAAFLTIASLDAGAWGRVRAAGGHQNASGGYSAGSVRGFRTPYGGSGHGWAAASDGQGNAVVSSGRAFRGPNGNQAMRAGYTTRTSDGAIQHQGGSGWQGKYGQGTSQTSFSSDGQGNASGSVNTTYSANNGSSYQGNTSASYSNGSATITHTGTCYDVSGNAVSCPSR